MNKKELAERWGEVQQITKNKDQRIFACKDNLWLYSLLYHTDYHHYAMPDFHLDFYNDCNFEAIDGALWYGFRESAKTSIAKIALENYIIYSKCHFVLWVSFEQKKAESNLFDVALELQTNKKIIADFGQLFYEESLEKKSKKKSVGEFITKNNIKVKAYSTGQSPRGEVFGPYRPDLIILDDIETSKTIVSEARTKQVTEFIDELLSGAAGNAKILVLGNKITYNGSLAYLESKVKFRTNWAIRDVPVERNGVIAWPEKYVMTQEQADEKNKLINNPLERVVSLEKKKLDLGETVYNREMLNQPLTDDMREIKLKWLQNYFNPEALKDKALNRYITIDVADSKAREKTDPDYTGTVIVDWDMDDNWNVQLTKQDRFNSPELIDWIFYLWQTYKPIKIGIEKKSLEDQVLPYIKLKSQQTGVYPVVVELKHGGINKVDRIRGALQGRLQAGKIKFINNSSDDTDVLKMQLYDFPKSAHDDLVDALAYIQQIGTRPYSRESASELPEIEKEFYAIRKKKSTGIMAMIRRL